MDFAELVEKYELENEEELQKSLADSDVSEDAAEGLVKAARVVSAFADEVTGENLETVFKALGYEFESETEKSTEDEPEDDPELSKSALEDQGLDPAYAEAIEKMVDEREEQSERIEKLEDRLEDREEDDALEKWISKANEFDALAGKAESIGRTLRAIEKTEGAEAAEDHLDMLRGADEAVAKSGLFEEVGVSGSGGTSDAEDELEKRIDKIQKSADEDMSRYDAKRKAYRQMDSETREELSG